jgi:SnoaL-like domain
VPDVTNEEIVERYIRAVVEDDSDEAERLRDPGWTAEWPQSGEQVVGSADFRAIQDHYPGGRPTARVQRLIGLEDRWVMTPANTVIRVAGSGDHWWFEYLMRYPDGIDYSCISLLELRSGKVVREIVYWAVPYEAPAWRAQWVRPLTAEPTDRRGG